MKHLIIALSILVLSGCASIERSFESALRVKTVKCECRHIVVAQYLAAVEEYGEENVKVFLLKKGEKYHAQVRVTIDGKEYWLRNWHVEASLESTPRDGYEVVEELDPKNHPDLKNGKKSFLEKYLNERHEPEVTPHLNKMRSKDYRGE